MSTDWTEKTWNFEYSKKNPPQAGKDAIFGTSSDSGSAQDREFKIEIDLSKGGFAKYFEKSVGKDLGLALTSAIDPGENGRAYIYKMYSRNEEKVTRRPVLQLVTTFSE
jgi:hypothetical protein